MKIVQRALAKIDVIDIGDAFALNDLKLAQRFVLDYEHFQAAILHMPKMYAKVGAARVAGTSAWASSPSSRTSSPMKSPRRKS